jgi:L-arginine dehydrogenase
VVTDPRPEELDPVRVVAAVRGVFERLAAGAAVQPPSAVVGFPGGGDMITYSGVDGQAGVVGVKVSPYLPSASGAVVTAWTLLLSSRTGQPVALLDSLALTAHRTAATSALAVQLLARPGARSLAVVGGGPLALQHLRYARAVAALPDVRTWTRSGHSLLTGEPGVRSVPTVEEAVDGADVVLLCTSAAEAVVDAAGLRPGALVVSISTNAPMAREIAPEHLSLLDVYCDVAATTPDVAGEMVLARRSGAWDPAQVRGDLAALVAGRAPLPTGERPVFFRSVGQGLEDVAVAALLVGDLSGS